MKRISSSHSATDIRAGFSSADQRARSLLAARMGLGLRSHCRCALLSSSLPPPTHTSSSSTNTLLNLSCRSVPRGSTAVRSRSRLLLLAWSTPSSCPGLRLCLCIPAAAAAIQRAKSQRAGVADVVVKQTNVYWFSASRSSRAKYARLSSSQHASPRLCRRVFSRGKSTSSR